MPITASGVLAARAALAEACLELGFRPTEEAIYWILGFVAGESDFGTGPGWVIPNELNTPETNPDAPPGPSHNWGAVRTSQANQPFIWHHDADLNGKLGTGPGPKGSFKFARYSSAKEAAKGLLQRALFNEGPKNLRTPGPHEPNAVQRVKEALTGDGDAYKLAAAMYDKGYYEGVSGNREDRIKAYTALIVRNANQVRKALGLPAPPNTPGPAPEPAIPTAPGGPSILPLLLLGGGAFAVYQLSRKRGKLAFT